MSLTSTPLGEGWVGDASATSAAALRDIEQRHGAGLQPKRPRALDSGRGAWLIDVDGQRILDFSAGHGVAVLGHGHPRWIAAITAQAKLLVTCPDAFPTPRRSELMQRMLPHLPDGLDRLFLCNSGTEAVEAALKFARVATGRTGVVAFHGAFHGRTFGALSATARPAYRAPFEPLVPGFSHARFDDIEAARACVDEDTAAVILELVQGEGGVRPASADFVAGLRELCDSKGVLLIVDEVQTGFGRTGRMFACEHHALRPDMLCLGKAIAGGLPMGAVAFGEAVGKLPIGSHGSTFGGNPLACAAALSVLDVIEEERLVQRAQSLGRRAMDRLHAAFDVPDSPVRELRGEGLMIGIELRFRVSGLIARLLELGLSALPAGPNVLRLLPPLVLSDADLECGLDLIVESIREEAEHARR